MVPNEMRAIAISQPGAACHLQLIQTACPKPEGTQILIRLHASGVNRPDILQRQGRYPPPINHSPFLGLEGAGVVVACGHDARRFALGTKVMALLPGGGYADYAIVDERHAIELPENMDFVTAAAIPECFLTVWHNVFELGQLKEGEILLVHGGASGIGTTALQLAKIFGAKVAITAGSNEKCRACLNLGADLAINHQEADFVEVLHDYTNGHGGDVIFDMVGGDYVERNYRAAAIGGRIIQIAFLKGHRAEINLAQLMQKRLLHSGSTLRGRDDDFKANLVASMAKHVLPFLKKGQIRPVIDHVLPLEEACTAHQRMEANQHIGKIVLKIV